MASTLRQFRRDRRQGGFTLLEILVVMIMLGIILSMAVLSVGNRQADQLEEDARRLLQVLRLAQEEAILTQQELAIKFTPHTYELLRYDHDSKKWQPIPDSPLFRRRELDEGYELKLLQDGLAVSLDDEDNSQVLLYSSGEMTPFELQMALPDTEYRYRLIGDVFGNVHIEDLPAYGAPAEDEV